MSTFQTQIQNLATSFVDQVVNAIRGSSLQEILSPGDRVGNGRQPRSTRAVAATSALTAPPKTHRSGRLRRRSVADIKAGLGKIVTLLQKHGDGLRAEQIRSTLGLQSKEMPRILKEGLATKALRSKGQKRATTYFVK